MDSRFQQRLDRIAEAFKDQFERKKLWLLCGFSLFYLASTCFLASEKLLWNDELYTFYIARLPGISDIWSALSTGADQIPPFFHMITLASLALFGVNHLSIRLPEVLGFWVMCLCLFQFVYRRSSPLYGFVAMLFPLVTHAHYYAYEARPYGLVLGFCGLSLLCWQSAAAGRYRTLSMIGSAVSFAAAVSNHYYAVLLFLPLALGEAVRSFSLRRLDLPIWLAFGFGLTPLLLFLPLIKQARTYSATFWAQPSWMAISDFYHSLLKPAMLPLVAMLILSALYSTAHPSTACSRNHASDSGPQFYEIAAAFGFIAIPVVAVMLAMLFTGAFVDRYALPSVIGFSILFAFASNSLLAGRAITGVVLIVLFCGAFLMLQFNNFQYVITTAQNRIKTYDFLQSDGEHELPIIASDAHTFMLLTHDAPWELASRLAYLANPGSSLYYLGHGSLDQGLLDLRPWFPLKIEEYGTYLDSHQRFLVYVDIRYLNGKIASFNWLLSKLIESDMLIELKSRYEHNLLFLVSHKDKSNNGQANIDDQGAPAFRSDK